MYKTYVEHSSYQHSYVYMDVLYKFIYSMNMHTSMHARTHYTIARLHIHYTGASGAKPVVGVTVASSELSDLQIKCKTYQEELAEVCAVHRHN